MADQSGIQFDPEVVETLISVLSEDRSLPLREETPTSIAI
jgi:HD-GYP domain-containing protein (c-di-GMP phosphodiesterase class II)